MTRPLFILGLAAIVAASSCKKNTSTEVVHITDTTYTLDTTTYPDTSYYISGLFDQTSGAISLLNVPIQVSQNGITDTRITLSTGDLPPNATAQFYAESGYPPFSTSLMVYLKATPKGNYPITIKSTTENNTSKSYVFNLKVTSVPKKTCDGIFQSHFTTDNFTLKDSATGEHNDIKPFIHFEGKNLFLRNLFLNFASTAPDDYYISDDNPNTPNDPHDHVLMTFNCDNADIEIPTQEIVGKHAGTNYRMPFYVSGKGKVDFATNIYTIVYNTTFNDSCTLRTANVTMTGKFNY